MGDSPLSRDSRWEEHWQNDYDYSLPSPQSKSKECEMMDQREEDEIHKQTWDKIKMVDKYNEHNGGTSAARTSTADGAARGAARRRDKQQESEARNAALQSRALRSWPPNEDNEGSERRSRRRCRRIESPPPLALPPPATNPPPFVGTLRACAVAAQALNEDEVEWNYTNKSDQLSQEEKETAISKYVQTIEGLPALQRTIEEEDLLQNWIRYQRLQADMDQAHLRRRYHQSCFKDTILALQAAQRAWRMQQQNFKNAVEEVNVTRTRLQHARRSLDFK
jgi:hypothetical protein